MIAGDSWWLLGKMIQQQCKKRNRSIRHYPAIDFKHPILILYEKEFTYLECLVNQIKFYILAVDGSNITRDKQPKFFPPGFAIPSKYISVKASICIEFSLRGAQMICSAYTCSKLLNKDGTRKQFPLVQI